MNNAICDKQSTQLARESNLADLSPWDWRYVMYTRNSLLLYAKLATKIVCPLLQITIRELELNRHIRVKRCGVRKQHQIQVHVTNHYTKLNTLLAEQT